MPYRKLLEGNARWSTGLKAGDPGYFDRLAAEHRPRSMFIGCSDARVPVDTITEAEVGELFVHRNIANQVSPIDASLAAGLQYAVEVLGVTDVIICGHYGCGGCRAALSADAPPVHVDAYLASLRMLARVHRHELDTLTGEQRVSRLVDLNVIEQVEAMSRLPSVRAAWEQGRPLRIHGWVFDVAFGTITPHVRREGPHDVQYLQQAELVASAK